MTATSKHTPAFPSHGTMGEVAHEGMWLRDYFAAKALPIADAHGMLHYGSPLGFDDLAKWSYQIADAMLKARES